MPLLSLDETVARIDAVSLEDLGGLVEELWSPERLSAAGIGPDEDALRRCARLARAGARGDALVTPANTVGDH